MSISIKLKIHELVGNFPRAYVKMYFSYKLAVNFLIIYGLKRILSIDIYSKSRLPAKKGDVCFILGSGASLNDITSSQWNQISNAYSIGFNFSFLHKHVPNIQFLELAKDDRGMFNELSNHVTAGFSAPLIIKGLVSFSKITWAFTKLKKLSMFNNVYLLRESILPAYIGESLEKGLMLRYSDSYTDSLMRRGFTQSKGSITMMLDFAVQLGYKNVVLIGVDLQGPYFYQDSHSLVKTGQINGKLLLQSKSKTTSSIEELILFWSKYLKEERNVNIYVTSCKSKLYPNLPLYWQ